MARTTACVTLEKSSVDEGESGSRTLKSVGRQAQVPVAGTLGGGSQKGRCSVFGLHFLGLGCWRGWEREAVEWGHLQWTAPDSPSPGGKPPLFSVHYLSGGFTAP